MCLDTSLFNHAYKIKKSLKKMIFRVLNPVPCMLSQHLYPLMIHFFYILINFDKLFVEISILRSAAPTGSKLKFSGFVVSQKIAILLSFCNMDTISYVFSSLPYNAEWKMILHFNPFPLFILQMVYPCCTCVRHRATATFNLTVLTVKSCRRSL